MATENKQDKIEQILEKLDALLQAKTGAAIKDLQKDIDKAIKQSGDELKQIIKSNKKKQ